MPMTDRRDERDSRLRKLFSLLPGVGVPDDFEEGLRRRIAAGGGRRSRGRLSAWAIPAFSLVVVGALTILVYRAGFDAGEQITPSGREAPAESLQAPSRTVPGSAEREAGPPAPDAVPRTNEKSGERKDEPRAAEPRGRLQDAGKVDAMRSKAAPRLMKSEGEALAVPPTGSPGVPDSSARADSSGRADSLRTDSTGARMDSLDLPGEPAVVPPDSVEDPGNS